MLAYGFQPLCVRSRSYIDAVIGDSAQPRIRREPGLPSLELRNRNSFWENGTRSGKTEPVLGKRNPFWENRTRSGKTELVLKKKRQPRFPGTAAFGLQRTTSR